MRALVKIGDKRAVPTLMKILTTSADDQDFLLNQKAALGLAEFRDPQSIPALIKGLFMTGRGTGIFQECRLALVRIGAPAVDPLIALLQEKNPDIQDMAAKLKFEEPPPVGTPGVVPHKAAIILGDLRAKKAVPALAARLQPEGARRRAPLGADRARLHRDAAGGGSDPRRSSRTPRPTRPSAPRPPMRSTCRVTGARCRRCWRSRSRAT